MRIKNSSIGLLVLLSALWSFQSCEKKPTDYRKFLDEQEIVYPGLPHNIQVSPGDNRLLLSMIQSSDPTIARYVIYWNNQKDSVMVNVNPNNPSDTLDVFIDNLPEGAYSFVIYSFDDKNNRSIPISIENVDVYGSQYQSRLLNRGITSVNYSNDSLILTWSTADSTNINTELVYTDTLNHIKTVSLQPDQDSLFIIDWKLLSGVHYQSTYKPASGSIDSFTVLNADSVDLSGINFPIDKSDWTAMHLPNDAATYSAATTLDWLWDGHAAGYPQIYHTHGDALPHTFTFDLGKEYRRLIQMEEWGRTDCSCTNPTDFEVWGIADTAGAVTTLPATDPGWKSEAIAKGWALLSEVVRNDDGINGIKVNLMDNPPAVRYIRIRVLHTTNETKKYSHMSEISFWYNPLPRK